MPTKYITDGDVELVVDNYRRLRTIGGKEVGPKGGGLWKLIGYIPSGRPSGGLTSEFQPGCCLLLFDETEEHISYKSPRLGVYEIPKGEKVLQRCKSKPIKLMEEIQEDITPSAPPESSS